MTEQVDWTKQRVAIALCNNQTHIHSDFFWNFLTIAKPRNHVVLRGQARMKAASLNYLVQEAFRWNADKILFMDVDQTFPFDTIPKLLSRNLPVISGLTHLNDYPYSPAAGWLHKDKKTKIAECRNTEGKRWKNNFAEFPDNENHLVEVDWVGVSCLMVDMDVFNKIFFPCFFEQWDKNIGDRVAGHDVLFCEAARKAGYKIYVDTLVQCGHIGQINVSDVFAKAYHRSNLEETEQDILKEATQNQLYWDEQYFAEKLQRVKRMYSKEWDIMLSQLAAENKVAEVGCGMGHLMDLMKLKGITSYGYDFSKVAIDTIKERGLRGEVADLRTFKPNGVSYDCVVGSHVLEHMKDDVGFLKTCASMLTKKSGKVIMSVPSDDQHPISLMEHQHNYSNKSLRETMKKVFKNVTIKAVTKERFGQRVKPAFVAIGTNPHGIRLRKAKTR